MQSGNNIHDASIASINDATSFEREPDIFVTHIATVKLCEPKSQARRMRHELRAGRKIYHQCGAVIIELKQGPSRLLIGEEYEIAALANVAEAQNDLLQYCSAYFACYAEATRVVAFATGGPFWTWANVKRSKTPKWNFLEGRANIYSPKNKRLSSGWNGLFSTLLRLGTQESDKVLTEINQKYIYTLLAHTPDIPAHFLVEEEVEEEAEEEGEEEVFPDDGRWSQEEEEEEEGQD